MAIKSSLTGKRGAALPFTDYCPVIASDGNHFQELFGKVVEYGEKAKWKNIEFRGGEEYLQGNIPSQTYLTHNLDLTHAEQEIFSTFRKSTKRNIKKAIKEGIQVKILNNLDSVKSFYRLNCMTRKDHGLPPQPFYFFRKLFEHIISKEKGFITLASYNGKEIAGCVYLNFKDKAIYKYGDSDKKYQNLRPNNLVMWEAIKFSTQNGFKSFNFGRTEPDHEGLLQFKRGWGTREETTNYYKYDLTENVFVKDSSRINFFNPFFQKMPLPLLKLTGYMLYRHVG